MGLKVAQDKSEYSTFHKSNSKQLKISVFPPIFVFYFHFIYINYTSGGQFDLRTIFFVHILPITTMYSKYLSHAISVLNSNHIIDYRVIMKFSKIFLTSGLK